MDQSARYEQYGMSEEAVWERVSEMDEWWRESTWCVFLPLLTDSPSEILSLIRLRLIERELPDL